MSLFKKILYPTDFSENSIDLMYCVLELSMVNRAELIILYTYRLNDTTGSPKSNLSIKKDMEKKAYDTFKNVDDRFLNLSDIKYKLLIEAGLMYDKIVSNVATHNIDLVVLSRDLQKQFESSDPSKIGVLLPELPCPVLILPPCRPIRKKHTLIAP